MIDPVILNQRSLIKPWVQDIYWANIQGISKPSNLGTWQGYFSNFTKPYIIFTGTNRLPLEKLKLTPAAVEYLNREGLRVFTTEALHLRLEGHLPNREYFTEFKANTLHSSIRSDELDSIADFMSYYGLTNVKFAVADFEAINVLQPTYPNIQILENYMFMPEVRRVLNVNLTVPKKIIKKPFFCAVNRYAPHRHLAMAMLANYEGYYSWQYEVSDKWFNSLDWLEKSKLDYKYVEMIYKGNSILNNNHFYFDYKLEEKIKINDFFNVYYKVSPMLSGSAQEFSSIRNLYQNSFVAVIPETRYAQPLTVFTEKSFAAMANRSPFIVVGTPHTLKHMIRMGGKTFSEYWDESYDSEEDPTIRMNKIFKVFEYINSLSLSDQQSMYESMSDILDLNQAQLTTLSTKGIPASVY